MGSVRCVLIIAATGLLSACGGQSQHKPVVCVPSARPTLAAHLRVPLSVVSQAISKGNNGMPQCVLKVSRSGQRPVQVTANLDNGAQPYFRLERTSVEASQQFGTERLYAAPDLIMGLGLDAYWYPDANYVQTTDGVRLITVTVGWPGSSQAQRRALSVAVARGFIGRIHHNPNAGY
jgi:hypothetical protein